MKKQQKNEWQKLLSRTDVDITTISWVDNFFIDLIAKFTKGDEELFFTHFNPKNREFTHYIGIDPQPLGRMLYKKYFSSAQQIKTYYRDGLKILKLAESFKFVGADEQTFQLWRETLKQVGGIYSIISWLAIEAWQKDLELALAKLIKKEHLESAQDDIIASVYKPWKNTAVNEIQNKLQKGAQASQLLKEYQFLRSWALVWHKPITKDWFKSFKTQHLQNFKQKVYSFDQLVKLLKPNSEEKKFLRDAPYLVFFKDWRDDMRRKHAYYSSYFLKSLSKKLGCNYEDLGYFTIDEMYQALQNKNIDKKAFAFRKKTPIIIAGKTNAVKVMENVASRKYLNIVEKLEKQKDQDIKITGNCASPGKAWGKVVIISSYHDIKKVEMGDILIANTTHPNYLPAMQKASAFVTNEGGLISHAAIVAREMKKPCIVGAKIATKVFKSGDKVEVDAEKGIVTKLS